MTGWSDSYPALVRYGATPPGNHFQAHEGQDDQEHGLTKGK